MLQFWLFYLVLVGTLVVNETGKATREEVIRLGVVVILWGKYRKVIQEMALFFS